jgi:hypothetical protein
MLYTLYGYSIIHVNYNCHIVHEIQNKCVTVQLVIAGSHFQCVCRSEPLMYRVMYYSKLKWEERKERRKKNVFRKEKRLNFANLWQS